MKVETLPLLFLPKRLSHFYSCLREFVFSWLKDLFLPAATERKWKARIEEESLNIFMFTSRSVIVFILAEGFFIFAGEVFIFAFRRDFLFLSWRIESGVTQPWVQRHEELSFQMLSKILTSQIVLTDWIKMIPNVVKDFDVSGQDQDDEETFYWLKLFSQNSLPSSDSAIQ